MRRSPLGDVYDGQRFASNLRAARRACGITQAELAYRSGLNRTTIGLLENAKRTPMIDTVVVLAGSLGIGVSDLLEDVAIENERDAEPGTLPPKKGHDCAP